jgi:EAL domain-containing protein (putative c-di-GMP-specific phosphodiesterase class I)
MCAEVAARPPAEAVRSLIRQQGALRAAFQPILDLTTGAIAGYEALARFPPRLPFRPEHWFESAKGYGLGPRLEAATLRAALSKPGRPDGTFLSLNVSPTALLSGEVQSALPEALEGIVIEITENELVDADDPVLEAIAVARARGAAVAMDDVGTGYAGLAQLMRVMPEMIKLDRSLVSNAHEDLGRAALIEGLVGYGQRTHTLVCAEGIESREQLALMVELGVLCAQGTAIARPTNRWASPSKLASQVCSAAASDDAVALLPVPEQEGAVSLELITSELVRASSVDDINRAAEDIAQALGADEAYVSSLVEDGRGLLVIAGFGGPGIGMCYWLRDFPATTRVMESLDVAQLLASDAGADPAELRLMQAQGIKAMLMLPICHGDRTMGLLELYRRAERRWDEGGVAAARATSQQLGVAMEHLRKLGRLNATNGSGPSSNRLAEMVRRRVGL